jgi:putrescine transport system substrate-binding protein
MAQAALNDPGNVYGVIYTWGTYGIGYNEQKAAQVLPNTPLRSWGLIFDPAFAAKLAPCGINIVDTPAGVTRAALKYLGRNPNEPTAQDLTDVDTPTAIRRQRLCSTSGPRRILPSFLPLISGRS